MKIDQETAKIINGWIKTKCKDFKCPGCQKKHWDFGDIIVAETMPVPIKPTNNRKKGKVTLASLVCSNCGFVSLLSVPGLSGTHPKG